MANKDTNGYLTTIKVFEEVGKEIYGLTQKGYSAPRLVSALIYVGLLDWQTDSEKWRHRYETFAKSTKEEVVSIKLFKWASVLLSDFAKQRDYKVYKLASVFLSTELENRNRDNIYLIRFIRIYERCTSEGLIKSEEEQAVEDSAKVTDL